ncbi:hypothetical protein [Mongoliimonas terrestris]|nr:hypothetical protein [Mongoliimonas terrestris]
MTAAYASRVSDVLETSISPRTGLLIVAAYIGTLLTSGVLIEIAI